MGDNDVVRRREYEQYQRDMERRVADVEKWQDDFENRRRWTWERVSSVVMALIALGALWLQAVHK